MNIFNDFRKVIQSGIEGLSAQKALPQGLDFSRVSVEAPRDPTHGDISTNAALVLAKPAGCKPRDLGDMLAKVLLEHDSVVDANVAGPGFVNLKLSDSFWQAQITDILTNGVAYGDSDIGAGEKINLEFVSANPTGPMHVGHARGAVVGDALASLLAKAGFDVAREYYINDAGAQVDLLAKSAHLRYREALGDDIGAIPEGHYPGDYLKDVGRNLAERDGKKWLDVPEDQWLATVRTYAIDAMLDLIREDLSALGVEHDLFRSERALVDAGAIDAVVSGLEARDLVYTGTLAPPKGKTVEDWESRPQLLFRATQFGDDVDRPLRKSDGSWTYFASDIAYHLDKFNRGFAKMIDVWGADHKGYISRMQAAVKATSEDAASLTVCICNLVHLLRDGAPVAMSKRAGTYVTLRDVVDEVGRDVTRFIMLTRGNEAALDFDFAKVTEQSRDNPVFYVQYAHARACSVTRAARDAFQAIDFDDKSLAKADFAKLCDSGEIGLIRLLAAWPKQVEVAAIAHEPHRIAYFLADLAAAFHGHWARGNEDVGLRFVIPDDPELTRARLSLVRSVALVIASGLSVMGVAPVEEM